ncbi:hypothetical protein F4779DRAFT_614761 [Xylariaceae sp. FL0662B]|nr:hypothetical protein F4779DRAFT_614761 [Xylariaceae sp. FL0662B]
MTFSRTTSRAGCSPAAAKSLPKTSSTSRMSRSNRDNVIRGPWADGPWPLIETPSKSQRITHPALHIANELAHTHNAMLRGLNAIFLQAPHVHQPTDISDILFLTQSWSAWVLDHHRAKETSMLPGFEGVLGLPPGSLTLPTSAAPSSSGSGAANDNDNNDDTEATAIEALLRNVHAYAAATRPQPHTYSPTTLQGHLGRLAGPLVALMTRQVPQLVGLRDFCLSATSPGVPAIAITSSPLSPFQHPLQSPTPPSPNPTPDSTPTAPAEEADRASKLLHVFLGCETAASDAMDRFVVPPMVVRLRDASATADDWPRLSVLAVHAVADKLSPRHAGAWRFLPCDVWGRPRELAFLGRRGEEPGAETGRDGDADVDADGGVR